MALGIVPALAKKLASMDEKVRSTALRALGNAALGVAQEKLRLSAFLQELPVTRLSSLCQDTCAQVRVSAGLLLVSRRSLDRNETCMAACSTSSATAHCLKQ